ncbi:hypothetical protein [Xylophilus ampelinus]|uniref:Uncharacterized protein n=2 Tax=Xylophilus ampelinus TaxID=54067 RepID=A0A318SKJ8_9BURK|nr:hypothetical protein [Xylophilus ampelinus]PYE79396.1 hypothetical protein DFQ15_102129 [Xylophilus ampelinus]
MYATAPRRASVTALSLAPTLAAAALLLGSLLAAAPAHAARGQDAQADAPQPYRTARHRVSRPRQMQGGSGETTAERDRRLNRECRGLPNAGACLGYGR